MTGNKTQRQWIGLSYRFATMLIALLFIATGKVKAQTPYFKINDKTLTFYSVDGKDTQGGTKITEWGTYVKETNKEINPTWASENIRKNITTVIFDLSFAAVRPTSCFNWFKSFINLSDIQGIENLNTEEVTNMNGMFYECSSLYNIDVSHFNTAKVTDMAQMFGHCTSLQNIDVSHFVTSEVTDMNGMFAMCWYLKSIDVSNFNTSKVTNMNAMFAMCSSLTDLDVTNFNTAQATTMSNMFFSCSSLTNINLKNFNTEKVSDFENIFASCSSLTTLDLTNFNTNQATNMKGMFESCGSLKTIYASDKFVVDNVTTSTDMFKDCNVLVGVIPYDAEKLDKKWANNVTGYFMPYYQINDTKYPALGDKVALHLEDENTFAAQAPFNINEGSYTRHKMASDWGTVCVPFVINTEDASTNCTFYQLNNISNDAIEISQISDATIAAGVPVIVKRNEGVIDLYVAAVKDDDKGTGVVTAPQNGTTTNHLEGTFVNQKVSKKCYFLAKNKFWYVGQIAEDGEIKGVHVYPFRAYLTCPDDAQQPNSLNIVVKDETNSVENPMTVDSLFSDKAEYYDAAGRRIHTLQKGLNIVRVGGQTRKVIIK